MGEWSEDRSRQDGVVGHAFGDRNPVDQGVSCSRLASRLVLQWKCD
jgi:hypothetical protein